MNDETVRALLCVLDWHPMPAPWIPWVVNLGGWPDMGGMDGRSS